MVDDERLRELEERYEGYAVVDNAGDKIGKVDDLFVDDVDNEEYIGVKMGLFGLSGMTLIPMELCQADESNRQIMVNDTKEHVKEAPNFRDDDEITAEYEDRIRQHFGLSGPSPSSERGSYGRYEGGAAGAGAAGAAVTGASSRDDRYADERSGDRGGYEDDRYESRPKGGVEERGVATPDTSDIGRPDDERFAGAAMGGINRKEQAQPRDADRGYDDHDEERREPVEGEMRRSGEPGETSFGGERGPGAVGDSGAPVGGAGYEETRRTGGQRGDYDRGYEEGYRRAMEELRSSQGVEGGEGSSRTRVRRRVQRLT